MTPPRASKLPLPKAKAPRDGALTLDQVARAGLLIVDAEGLDGLTIRRLAVALGTSPTGIYRVAADKEEILAAIGEIVTAMLEIPAAGPWDQRLFETFVHLRELVIEHPAAGYINFFYPPRGPAAIARLNAIVEILVEGGLHGARAVAALRMLAGYTFGYSVLGLAYASAGAPQHSAVQAAPAQSFPFLSGVADPLTAPYSDEEFRAGLTLIIDGLKGGAFGADLPD